MSVLVRPPETFETQRLILRPPVLTDADAIFARYGQDPEVSRYMPWRPHADTGDTQAFLSSCLERWGTGSGFPWALIRKEDHHLIGMIELGIGGHRADIGYVLARAYWGQGYMTEAVRVVVDWALRQPGIYRVWAVCDVENVASARVLEKVGMHREGVLRRWSTHPNRSTEPRDSYSYAITK